MNGFEQDSTKPHTGDIKKPGERGRHGPEGILELSGDFWNAA